MTVFCIIFLNFLVSTILIAKFVFAAVLTPFAVFRACFQLKNVVFAITVKKIKNTLAK